MVRLAVDCWSFTLPASSVFLSTGNIREAVIIPTLYNAHVELLDCPMPLCAIMLLCSVLHDNSLISCSHCSYIVG